MPVFAVRRRPRADDDSLEHFDRERRVRLVLVVAVMVAAVVGPAISGAARRPALASMLLLAGAIVFVGLVMTLILMRPARPGPASWAGLVVTTSLGVALFSASGEPWLVVLALSAAACGSFTRTPRPATGGGLLCGGAGFGVAVAGHYGYGDLALVTLVPAMAAFFAYTAGKRSEVLGTLRQTRAELAQAAAARERLRIARDLHDLLGHSLSLITLKAELSRRMITTDAESAAREMRELEAVARQSLRDVREAVAGYRHPSLVAELHAARQLLSAAGLGGHITSPADLKLAAATDTVLAWTVREGVTNVVRHARATRAAVRITTTGQGVRAEITDNGRGHGPGPAGSGLTGLGERVRQLGGSLIAGPAPGAGFRLQVTIPAQSPAEAGIPSRPAPLSLAS
jgi:two-component system sensor histidine kinase DesK